jgi:hypothetical protein
VMFGVMMISDWFRNTQINEMLARSAVDRGFEPRSRQTKD